MIDMKKILFLICLTLITIGLQAQRKKKVKEPIYPAKLEAYIDFDEGSSYYTKDGLNTLDSIYMLAFNKKNNRFYKMTITGYDDGEPVSEQTSRLARDRAVMVFKYFSSREETEYIIKRTPSYYESSCEGKKEYYIKYKMPFDFRWINLANNDEWKQETSVMPKGKVHVLVEEDQEGCLGEFLDYDYPQSDTVMKGSAAIVKMPKGCIAYVHHTKDTLSQDFSVSYKEVMSFEELTENYFLVPHKKQYIVNAGYLVIHPSYMPDYSNCIEQDTAGRNIHISLFLEEQQRSANLKFYAKSKKPNGEIVYKSIRTSKKKNKDTGELWLEADITPDQLDTVYLGKKVEAKDMKDYFYSAKSEEPGSFEAMGGWLRTYKLDSKGNMQMKDKMKAVLRKPVGKL